MTEQSNEQFSGPGAGLGETGATIAADTEHSDYGAPGGDDSSLEEEVAPDPDAG